MFLELLRKEFIERRSLGSKTLWARLLSLLFYVLFVGLLIALECFIAVTLDKKIEAYSSYGSYDFLVLCLFLTMVVGIFFAMLKARSSLFNESDSRVTLPLPIPPSTEIMAKVVYIYAEAVLMELFIATPLLICYGASRHFIPYYYVFSILYPFIISVFIMGIALIFAIVYQQFYKLVKRSDIAQFVIASLLVIALCYLYKVILTLFLTALTDSAIGGVLSPKLVETIHDGLPCFLPVSYWLEAIILQERILSNVLISLGASFFSASLGIAITCLVFYHELRNGSKSFSKAKKEKKIVLDKPFKALLKKEMSLLFKDSTNIFSYSSLLIMCPFLTYAVISSLNSLIYSNLEFYAAYFPELISGINLTLILLFVAVINSSSSLAMSREGKALKIVKSIPISSDKQLLAKLLIPTFFSFLSLLITIIVLLSSGVISAPVFFSSLAIGALLVLFTNVFGLYCDMHDRSAKEIKMKLGIFNDLIPLLFPFVIFFLFFLLSIYLMCPSWALYLIAFCLSAALLVPIGIIVYRRYPKAFLEMEVSN